MISQARKSNHFYGHSQINLHTSALNQQDKLVAAHAQLADEVFVELAGQDAQATADGGIV